MDKQATLIVNPAARGLPSQRSLAEALDWLRRRGWQVAVEATQGPGHATSLAAQSAAAGHHLVLVCGGDGTISEVAGGLAGSDTALAVIPAGTARVWAKEARLPRRPLEAARLAVEGEAHRIDLGLALSPGATRPGESPSKGRADGRYFLLMAGVGLDGRIAQAVSPRAKRYLGATAYALTALREVLRYRGAPVQVRLDQEVVAAQLLMMVVGNTRGYAGITQVARRALADDGLLDVCVFQGGGTASIALHFLRVLAGAHLEARDVVYRQVRRVEVTCPASGGPLPVQIDGDLAPDSPASFEVAPVALKVMLPQGVRLPFLSLP